MPIGSMPFATPGPQGQITSSEAQVFFNGYGLAGPLAKMTTGTIDGAIRDAGNTGFTTTLRAGLLMSITSAGVCEAYDVDATPVADTDGSSRIAGGILPVSIRMTDVHGTDLDRWGPLFASGLIKRSQVKNLNKEAEATLVRQGVIFDDKNPNGAAMLVHPLSFYEEDGTAYTITSTDNGKLILANNAALVTLTLPTLTAALVGLSYDIMNVGAGGALIDGASNIINDGSILADQIELPGIGDRVRVLAGYVGATPVLKWIVEDLSGGTGVVDLPAEHGAGWAVDIPPKTSRRYENGTIITEIKVDLDGAHVTGTAAKDVIGLVGTAASQIGRYVVATYGIVYRIEMICIVAPTEETATITQDIDLGADDGLLAQDDSADDVVIDTATLVAGETVIDNVPALTANDYIYLIEGDTAATTGEYSGGQFIVRFYGHPVWTS